MVNVYEDQHFLRPEEARFEPGESLSCYQIFILFMRESKSSEYKDVFSLRDEIGTCPNIEVNIEVTDNLPFFI